MPELDNAPLQFDLPINQSNVIKVIGVGGGGSNAINHMFSQGIKGVDFVICNTDAQALENSPVPIKIQLGVSLTEGLGAGANPKIGEQSAMESLEEIKDMLSTNTKMVFITAGMGGGTGTGAAPIIARMAKEMDILTVGIVTIPFQFEGKMRNEQAQLGVENLRQSVDSLIVINNNKLREVYGNLGFKAGFSKADEVLATAARGIAEVITHHYTQNIDLRDAKTVLANSGTAIMGSAHATGSSRAKEAIAKALDSPLLNDNKITGAKNVLLLIVSGAEEITIDEIGEISDHIQDEAGHSANIIMGVGEDSSLEGAISITVIATGFNKDQQNEITNTEARKIIHTLEDEQRADQQLGVGLGNTVTEPTKSPVSSKEVAEEPVIRHTLFEEEEMEEVIRPAATPKADSKLPFEGYVETSDLIRNMEVDATVIDIHYLAEFEQIQINEIDVNQFTIVSADQEEEVVAQTEDQPEMEEQMLMFDMPINPERSKEQPIVAASAEEEEPELLVGSIEEIEVTDPVEVVPVTEVSHEGIKRYSLDDYEAVEAQLNEAKPGDSSGDDAELEFSTRTVESPDEATESDEADDPLNAPISKLLRDRTDERRRKMKEFNYKFRNSASKIDEIERQPAYKRMGIELDENTPEDTNISRTSVNTDDDDIDLRSNNSFLHDNVD
jgi:cell division protein FtsZ